jgi:hypothetical protein
MALCSGRWLSAEHKCLRRVKANFYFGLKQPIGSQDGFQSQAKINAIELVFEPPISLRIKLRPIILKPSKAYQRIILLNDKIFSN